MMRIDFTSLMAVILLSFRKKTETVLRKLFDGNAKNDAHSGICLLQLSKFRTFFKKERNSKKHKKISCRAENINNINN